MNIMNILGKYTMPFLIGFFILLAICIGIILTSKSNTPHKNEPDMEIENEIMSKAEKVGFVNFGDTEDLEFTNYSS